ncbi:MAG: hypothetical protein Q9210_004266 [Variospora velana]
MHHHFLFSLPFLLTLALPSFAILDEGSFIAPGTAEGGVKVKITRFVGSAEITVPFNSLFRTPDSDNGIYIAIIGLNFTVKGKNDTGAPLTLEPKEIACQCFRDEAGKKTVGTPFTVASKLGDPDHRIPSTATIRSIFCSDLRGLQRYFNESLIPLSTFNNTSPADSFAFPTAPTPPAPFVYLYFGKNTTTKQIVIPVTNQTVPVHLSATSVKMVVEMGENDKNADSNNVECLLMFKKTTGPTVKVGRTIFQGKEKIKSANCYNG